MSEHAEQTAPSAVVVRLELHPDAAKILDHLMAERLRIIAAEVAQHPPVHTRRVLDEHKAWIETVRLDLKVSRANPVTVDAPHLGGGE